jgi:hypothetical protein
MSEDKLTAKFPSRSVCQTASWKEMDAAFSWLQFPGMSNTARQGQSYCHIPTLSNLYRQNFENCQHVYSLVIAVYENLKVSGISLYEFQMNPLIPNTISINQNFIYVINTRVERRAANVVHTFSQN